jgi:uncharacterized protein GlcG (DUF336 family)
MPRSHASVTLDDAKQMSFAAEAKAEELGIPYNIAVVDAGGRLVAFVRQAFVRQDGALIGSIDLAAASRSGAATTSSGPSARAPEPSNRTSPSPRRPSPPWDGRPSPSVDELRARPVLSPGAN